MMVIIRLMAKIGGPEAEDLLLRKIDFPDKRMVHQVLAGFGYKDYNAQGNQAQIIMNLIDEEMAKTIWNMAAITELPKDEAVYTDLREALKEEVTHNGEQVFMLLSLLYDAQSVSLVKENVQSETSEGIAFGIELLDMFISSELKPKLYPLIDDMPIQEKVRKLHDYFPREEFTPRQLINNILNRDSNQLSRWVKACAIHTLGFMEDYETNYGILAHIFNKDMLLKEVAAWVVYHRDKDRFDQVMERLPISDRQQLIDTIKDNKLYDGLDDGYFLLVEIVMFLKQTEVFKDINGSLLCELADNTVVLQLKPDDTVDLRPSENNSIYVVAIGEAEVLRDGVKQERLLTKAIYGELFTPEKKLEDDTIRVVTNSVIFRLNLNNFYMLMSSSHEFTNQLLKAVTNKEVENA
jgi:AAA family ATP:ADP antiporter